MDHNSPSNHSNIITIILNTKEPKDQSQSTNANSANTHTNITTARREEITTTIAITLSPSLSESAREAIFWTLDSAICKREQVYWHVGSGLRRF